MFKIKIIIFITAGFIAAYSDSSAELKNEFIIDNAVEREINYNYDKNAYFLLIEKNLNRDKFDKVIRLLKNFKQKYPSSKERKFYYYSAVLNENKNEIIKAIDNYRKAIEICPEYSQARNKLGSLFLKIGKYQESEEQYRKAVEANPYNPFINYNLGHMYFMINKLDAAAEYLEKACKYKVNFGTAYNILGFIYFYLKDYTKTMFNFNKAIEFDSATYETYYFIKLINYEFKQPDLTISSLIKTNNIK